jgi:hypothetical protein
MQGEVQMASVERSETRTGKTRWMPRERARQPQPAGALRTASTRAYTYTPQIRGTFRVWQVRDFEPA